MDSHFKDNDCTVKPVMYSLERYNYEDIFNYSEYSIDVVKTALNCGILRKANIWSYEREWRLISHTKPQPLLHSPSLELSKIILGAKISQEDSITIERVANKIETPFQKTQLDELSYKINLVEI